MAEQEEGRGVGRDDKRCESTYPSTSSTYSQYEQHILTAATAATADLRFEVTRNGQLSMATDSKSDRNNYTTWRRLRTRAVRGRIFGLHTDQTDVTEAIFKLERILIAYIPTVCACMYDRPEQPS